MNIKDSYIHNGTAVLKDIKVESSVLKKILAGKDANDAYLDWETVCDLTGIKPTAAGTADKVGHKLTFSGGVTGDWDGSADKTVAIPTKSSWNYDDVYLKDLRLATGNSTDKDNTASLTNGNVYLKLFKTVNGSEAEDTKVKVYGATNVSVTTDSSGNIKVTGVDTVTSAKQILPGSYTPTNTTVAGHKAGLVTWLSTNDAQSIGNFVNISASIINHWDDDSFQYYASSSYAMIKIGGAYNSTTYGQWLLSSYNLTRVGIVGRTESAWSTIKWLAFTTDIPTKDSWNYDDVYVIKTGDTMSGHLKLSGTKNLGTSWDPGVIAGSDGHDKVVLSYLGSQTNGATIGGHNSALDAWAPLYIGGTTVSIGTNETKVVTINSSQNVGIGTTSPSYKLDVNGSGSFSSLNVNGSLSVNTGKAFNFYTNTDTYLVNKSLDWRASSYEYWVYLLLPVVTTTNTSADNHLDGVFHFWKNGGNIYDNVHVSLNCCYNTLQYSLMSYGERDDWKLVRCTYNGVEYYALQGYYHANPYNRTNFFGHVNSSYKGGNNTTDHQVNLPYGICYRYDPPSGNQILNSEVNNSITTTLTTSVITGVVRRGLANYGGFIGDLAGNASTATSSTYAGNVGSSGTAGTDYVSASNVISMYNWYNTITASDAAANTAIDKWNEIISFLSGITDTSTLSGILAGYSASGHNHDGRYVKVYNDASTNPDIDSTSSEFYMLGVQSGYGSGTKPPDTDNAVGIINMQTHGSYFTQLALETTHNRLWIRSAVSGAAFGSWAKLAYTSEIPTSMSWSNITSKPTSKTAWGQTYINSSGEPTNIGIDQIATMPYVLFKNYNDNGSAGYVGRGSGSRNDLQLNAYSGNKLELGANGAVGMTFDTSNNVGIGVAAPSYKLDVNGTGNISGISCLASAIIALPSVWSELFISYGLASDYTSRYDTEEFLKSWVKYALAKAAGYTVLSFISPNSRGFIFADVYASGAVTQAFINDNHPNATLGLPVHITGRYYPHGGSEIIFGTAYGVWYYKTGVDSGNIGSQSVSYATSAGTATNLSDNPSLQAGTTDTDKITVTAGGKTSAEFKVPFATRSSYFKCSGLLTSTDDYNSLDDGLWTQTNANRPAHTPGTDNDVLLQISSNGIGRQDKFQINMSANSDRMYFRRRYNVNDGWSDWHTIAWTSDIPTTMAWSSITGAPDVYATVSNDAATYSLNNSSWTNTITLPTTAGSYVLYLASGNSVLTGVFSIGTSDTAKDEISLHLHGNGPRLYARTNGTKLQLSRNVDNSTNTSVTIKYKRII